METLDYSKYRGRGRPRLSDYTAQPEPPTVRKGIPVAIWVKNLETGEEQTFPSIHDAAITLGWKEHYIRDQCVGFWYEQHVTMKKPKCYIGLAGEPLPPRFDDLSEDEHVAYYRQHAAAYMEKYERLKHAI